MFWKVYLWCFQYRILWLEWEYGKWSSLYYHNIIVRPHRQLTRIHFCYGHCNPLYLAPVWARHKFAKSFLEVPSTSIAFNWRSYSRPVCLNGVGGRKPFLHRAFTFLSPPQQREPWGPSRWLKNSPPRTAAICYWLANFSQLLRQLCRKRWGGVKGVKLRRPGTTNALRCYYCYRRLLSPFHISCPYPIL